MKCIVNLFENYFYSFFNRIGKTFAQECRYVTDDMHFWCWIQSSLLIRIEKSYQWIPSIIRLEIHHHIA